MNRIANLTDSALQTLEWECQAQGIDPERIIEVILRRDDNESNWEVWLRLRGEHDLIEVHGIGTPDYRETRRRLTPTATARERSDAALARWRETNTAFGERDLNRTSAKDTARLAQTRLTARREYRSLDKIASHLERTTKEQT